jgi:hypothetical protein
MDVDDPLEVFQVVQVSPAPRRVLLTIQPLLKQNSNILSNLKNMPKRMLDCHRLMEVRINLSNMTYHHVVSHLYMISRQHLDDWGRRQILPMLI